MHMTRTARPLNRRLNRSALVGIIPLVLLLAGCPKDEKQARRDSIPVDTTHLDTATATDLSKIQANIPAAEPDTFKKRKLTAPASTASSENVPRAPGELMDAVEREQSVTKFCYTEFGQKVDPRLSGNVAMVVTVGSEGITNATVGDSRWSGSAAGRAVNNCLNQKAKQAWKLAPGAVKPGKYVVQLSFSGA
ncbi:MAG: hypothetical protein HOQ09_14700 [Gemmatimonadaceae bacterium]|nr:hypothetical protein [Gemmatimonadaceae bacterium]